MYTYIISEVRLPMPFTALRHLPIICWRNIGEFPALPQGAL